MPSLQRNLRPLKSVARNVLQKYTMGQVRRNLPKISGDGISQLIRNSLAYVDSLHDSASPIGAYLYTRESDQCLLYSSVFSVLIKSLTGTLHNLSAEQKQEWADYLKDFQCEDGLFRDKQVANDIAEVADWWGWRHLTLLTLMAIQALDASPRYPLRFLEQVATPDKALDWLSKLDWTTRVSFTSNTIQNYVASMQYARDRMGEVALADTITFILNFLSEKASPKTGLWGRGLDDWRIALSEGVQAGYHFWLLYYYDHLEIPHYRSAFNSIVSLQNSVGGFNLTHAHSSACEDIDALDPIIRIANQHPSLSSAANPVVTTGLRHILYNFNMDGGAVFRRNERFVYGHEFMTSNPNQSSIFSTWFRLLNVAYCCEFLNQNDSEMPKLQFEFLDCPGYQFALHHHATGSEIAR